MQDRHPINAIPRILTSLALLAVCWPLAALEIEFADVPAARDVLGARDEYIVRLSPFDRAVRMKAPGDVSEGEFLAFVRQAAREWEPAERERIAAAFGRIEEPLEALLPELDEPILLIKTSGNEEAGAGYTRGNAVVLPQSSVAGSGPALERLLAHEVFHVVSRRFPALRRALYGAIGFHPCGEVELPDSLAARKVTNPDAPVNDYCIRLQIDGSQAWAVPVLLSNQPRYEPASDMQFFDYVTLSMLLVDRSDSSGPARPIEDDDGPALVPIPEAGGFFEQVGRNTDYIIHPEEILASNFVLLVMGRNRVPSPDVLERMRAAFAAARGAPGRQRGVGSD